MEIRECLMREYGAEVHLQQCRRAKTEILKKQAQDAEQRGDMGDMEQSPQQGQDMSMGGDEGDAGNQIFREINTPQSMAPRAPSNAFQLHTAAGVVTPVPPDRSSALLQSAVGEPPVRCPYCINHRWMRSIKDAVEHMSMHVVV